MHSSSVGRTAAASACKLRKNRRKQAGVQRVHSGNEMLKQQVIRKENKGSLGRAVRFLSSLLWLLLGHPHDAVTPEVSWKKPEERCSRGASELTAELWLSKDLSQLKQSTLKIYHLRK